MSYMSSSELPVCEVGLSEGVPGFTNLRQVRSEYPKSDTALVLHVNQPLVVTTGEYSDYRLVGIYIAKKSMTGAEYRRVVEKLLGGSLCKEYDDYIGVTTEQFLSYAIQNGYLMGPIAFTEVNDDCHFDITGYTTSVTDETS